LLDRRRVLRPPPALYTGSASLLSADGPSAPDRRSGRPARRPLFPLPLLAGGFCGLPASEGSRDGLSVGALRRRGVDAVGAPPSERHLAKCGRRLRSPSFTVARDHA